MQNDNIIHVHAVCWNKNVFVVIVVVLVCFFSWGTRIISLF